MQDIIYKSYGVKGTILTQEGSPPLQDSSRIRLTSDKEMDKLSLNQSLASIHNFEDYAKLKQEIEEDLAREILLKNQLVQASLTLYSDGTNIVFMYGEHKVIKIFPPFHYSQYASDRLALKHLAGKLSVKTPTLEHEGEIFGWPYLIMSKLEGSVLESLWQTMPHNNKVVIIRELGALICEVHRLATDGLEAIDCHWPEFLEKQIANAVEQHRTKGLSNALVEQLPAYLKSVKARLPKLKRPVLLTGEYTPMNVLVQLKEGLWHICGLLDFGDAMLGLPEYDLLGPGAFLIQGDKQLLREFLTAYGYPPQELTDTLSKQLTALMLLHQYSNLNIQIRIPDWKEKVQKLEDLENLVWGFSAQKK